MQRTNTKRLAATVLAATFLLGVLGGCGGPAAAPRPKGKATHMAGKKAGKPAGKKAKGAASKAGKKPGGAKKGGKKTAAATGTRSFAAGGAAGGGTTAPTSPASLPTLASLRPFNPGLRYVHRLSRFIPGMGFHLGAPGPGIVVMLNREGQVTGVEATFPQKLGYFPWFDPPTRAPNAGVAFYSEHLYFVPPASITPAMPASLPAALTSWNRFVAVNPRLNNYVRLPMQYKGMAVYGPRNGPGLLVLVASPAGASGTSGGGAAATGRIQGFLAEEPAAWGWFPWYAQGQGQPVSSSVFGKAYYSVLLLAPPAAG